MARKQAFILLIFILLTGCKDNNIQIKGQIFNPSHGSSLLLQKISSNSITTIDSIPLKNDGTFLFNVKIKEPMLCLLKYDKNNYLTLLLDPTDTDIEISAYSNNLQDPEKIICSEENKQMIEYNRKLNETISDISALSKVYEQNLDNPDLYFVMDSLDEVSRRYLRDFNSYTKDYIDNNVGSLSSLIALYQQIVSGENVLDPKEDLSYYMKVDSSLYKKYPQNDMVITLHQQVQDAVAFYMSTDANISSIIGNTTPEIALPDLKGDIISLSSTRGNIVLLDFWASWCTPCRTENPNLLMAYLKYHDQGFEIFQVSLDKTKEAWTKGIKEDGTGAWIHVSDLKYWESSVVSSYNLSTIPMNYLLDKEGKVIATNLRGDNLLNNLEQIFGY